MDPSALNATGVAFAALGVSLAYVFSIRPPAPSPAPHRAALRSRPQPANHAPDHTTDARRSATRDALGCLGYLALMDGFFLQFIASLETMRMGGMAG